MPANKSKASPKKPPAKKAQMQNEELLIRQLEDATELTRSLSKSLQDEILSNVQARTEIKKDIERLCETIADHCRVFKGNGDKPLEVRLNSLEKDLEHLAKARASEKETRKAKSERLFKFIMTQSPIILTWVGLAIWAALKAYLNSP
jgi:predicted RNA-binding Zn ribbon-like protein